MNLETGWDNRHKWSKQASNALTKFMVEKSSLIEKMVVEFNKWDELSVSFVTKKGLVGKEHAEVRNLIDEAKFVLKLISPVFEKKRPTFSIWEKNAFEKYQKSKVTENKDIQVLNNLKAFVNEEVKENLKELGSLLNENKNKKKQILIDKIGLNEQTAELMVTLCGAHAVWMTGKLIEFLEQVMKGWSNADKEPITNEDVLEAFNTGSLVKSKRQTIQSIMDFIRVGLNGNNSSIKNLDFTDLAEKALEWHESLEVGSGEINYVETNPILLDFRNKKNGLGFYWTNLGTNVSDEECKRMGHCGRTGYGNTIYSLRENLKIPGTNYTINKSYLTASVSRNGELVQLKGPKNSKPKEIYHQYILPLFEIQGEDGYFIRGFRAEYASEKDFKIFDLPLEEVKIIYEKRPDLFETRSMKRALDKLGIIELPNIDYNFIIELKPDEVGDYIDGDYVVRQGKRKDGTTYRYYFFETLLSGDFFDLYDSGFYEGDWESALDYYCDDENEKKIIELLKIMAGEEYDESSSIEEQIKEYDGDLSIPSAIRSANSDCESDDYHNYVYKSLKEALNEYGTVLEMNDMGVKIKIDLSNYLDDIRDEYWDELEEVCDSDPKCMFNEMVYHGEIDKPKYRIDDRYTPSCERKYFNEILSDRLSEVEYDLKKNPK